MNKMEEVDPNRKLELKLWELEEIIETVAGRYFPVRTVVDAVALWKSRRYLKENKE